MCSAEERGPRGRHKISRREKIQLMYGLKGIIQETDKNS